MRRRDLLGGGVALAVSTATNPGCVLDGTLKLPTRYAPEPLDDGWAIAAPEDVGLEPEALDTVYTRFFSENELITARSLVIVRDGQLIGDGYARDLRDRDRLAHVRSVTKSVTSLLVGQAIERGVLQDIRTPLGDLLPRESIGTGELAGATIEDLLTMRSGIDWANSRHSGQLVLENPKDTVAFIAERPMPNEPGVHAEYKDADPHLLGAALRAQTGQSLQSLATDWLARPLGIDELRWDAAADGVGYGAWGVWIRPRDLAKIGEVVRRGGTWFDTPIISQDWIERSRVDAVTVEYGEPSGYGYYWWLPPEFGQGSMLARGHGGQTLLVMPEHALTVVLTALPYPPPNESFGVTLDDIRGLAGTLIAGL